jgi:hypothetical protein
MKQQPSGDLHYCHKVMTYEEWRRHRYILTELYLNRLLTLLCSSENVEPIYHCTALYLKRLYFWDVLGAKQLNYEGNTRFLTNSNVLITRPSHSILQQMRNSDNTKIHLVTSPMWLTYFPPIGYITVTSMIHVSRSNVTHWECMFIS